MKDTLLIELLKTLKPEDLNGLQYFSKVGLVEKGDYAQYAPVLLEILASAYPDFDAAQIKKERVYERLFPDSPYKAGRMEKIIMEAGKIVRTFMQVKHYLRPDNEFNRNMDMAVILRHNGLFNRYEQWFSRIQKGLQEEIPFSENHFYHQYQASMEHSYWLSIHNQQKNDLNLVNTIQCLDTFFTYQRLILLNILINQRLLANCVTEEQLHALSQFTYQPEKYKSPLVVIAQTVNSLLQNIDTTNIETIDNAILLLKQEENKLQPTQLREYYTFLRNLCSMLHNRGLPGAVYRTHDLQVISLEKGYLTHYNKLTGGTYVNLTRTALLCKKFEWTDQFIEDYKGKVISENETLDLYRLNRAAYLFETGHFDEALNILPDMLSQLDHLLMAKRLELRAYYETNSELLPYKIHAFKMYLNRTGKSQLPDFMMEMHNNFVNILSQLQNSKTGDLKRSEQLLNRIKSKTLISERPWLIEKAQELANRKK